MQSTPEPPPNDALQIAVSDEARDRRATRLAVAACLLVTIFLGLLSNGVHHDDDLTHYLFARWSATYPGYLLHVWGRPGMTVPMALVSWLGDREVGWHAARYLSSLVSAAAALFAAGYARRIGLRPAWPVVLFCYGQPYFAMLSYTTLTENFTALYLSAALWLVAGGRTLAASAVFSLALLTRHEAIIFLPVWALVVWMAAASRRARWQGWALCLWAPVVHNVLHAWVFDTWPFVVFLRPGGSTEYLPQTWPSYLPHALLATGPVVAALAAAGAWTLLVRGRWQAPVLAGLFFASHAAIMALGVYASGGYARFMVAVAPLTAVLAWAGWNAIFAQDGADAHRGVARALATGAWLFGWIACELVLAGGNVALPAAMPGFLTRTLVLTLLLAAWGAVVWRLPRRRHMIRGAGWLLVGLAWAAHLAIVVRPLELRPQHRLVFEAVDWLDRMGRSDDPFFAANPWFAFALGLVENPRADKSAALLNSMPAGTIFAWDSIYTGSDFHGISLESVLACGAYRPLKTLKTTDDPATLTIILFEKTGTGDISIGERPRFPPSLEGANSRLRGVFYVREKQ